MVRLIIRRWRRPSSCTVARTIDKKELFAAATG
jgi:hypothetical protein